MKIKSKRYFEANYSFMKPLSQNFEVVSQYGDVINPKLARKWPKLISNVVMVPEI